MSLDLTKCHKLLCTSEFIAVKLNSIDSLNHAFVCRCVVIFQIYVSKLEV